MGRLRFWACGRSYDIPEVGLGRYHAACTVADTLGVGPKEVRTVRDEEPLYVFDVGGDPVAAYWYEHDVWAVLARHGDELVLYLVDAPDASAAQAAIGDGVEVIGVRWALFLPPTCPLCWGQGVYPQDGQERQCEACMGTGRLDQEVRLEAGGVDTSVPR